MATAPYMSNFHSNYHELTNQIYNARQQFLLERLQEWFALLDETPDVSAIISKYEDSIM
jgi:hypothetical protein